MNTLLAVFLLLSIGVEKPTFVENPTECLALSNPNGRYSRKDLAEAQYRWLAKTFPGYTVTEHATPKPTYLEKLGCKTKSGSILTISTRERNVKVVCFCLPSR